MLGEIPMLMPSLDPDPDPDPDPEPRKGGMIGPAASGVKVIEFLAFSLGGEADCRVALSGEAVARYKAVCDSDNEAE